MGCGGREGGEHSARLMQMSGDPDDKRSCLSMEKAKNYNTLEWMGGGGGGRDGGDAETSSTEREDTLMKRK